MATADDIAAEMMKAFGGSDEPSTVTQFLSSGYPELDHACTHTWDGAFPVGRVIEIYGPESSGKTAIATLAMVDAQKKKGFAGFSDHERSFDQPQGENLGLDPHPGKFMYKKPKTFEESLEICVNTASLLRSKKLIPDDAPICWVFDSLAFMVPNSAYYTMKGGKITGTKGASDRSMHDNTALARATSAAFPAFAQHCEDLGICAIFLNQIRMNIGVVYGNPETTPGGKTPKYVFSQRLSLGAKKITKGEGEDAVVLGMQIKVKLVKNKISRPFETAKYRFEFTDDGHGHFAIARSLIDFLVEQEILKKSGAFITWIDGKKFYADALAKKIEKEGLIGELKKLLPADYEGAIEVDEDPVEDDTAEAA
jgi:recombination protein RecA